MNGRLHLRQTSAETVRLTTAVEEFLASSEAIGNSDRYVDDQLRLLKCLFTEADMKILSDIDANRIVEWMNKASQKHLSAKTVNSYLKQAKQFTKFCVQSGYLTRDPLQHLAYRKSPDDQQEKRRAFTKEEFQKLIDITSRRPIAEHGRETLSKRVETKSRRRNTWTKAALTQQNFEECFVRGKQKLASNPKLLSELQRDGLERKLTYTIFTYSGMRLNELRSIRLSDIVEKEQQLLIVLRSQNAKNRKSFTFTLPSFVCDEIREWIKMRKLETTPSNGKTRDSNLLTVPKQLVRILDRDLIAAGIAKKDERGRTVNVHAFRHTYCTWLQASNISQRIVQELMRHSSPELTANTYTHSDQLDLGGSVEKLPNHGAPSRNKSSDPNSGELP
jgi:integrase